MTSKIIILSLTVQSILMAEQEETIKVVPGTEAGNGKDL